MTKRQAQAVKAIAEAVAELMAAVIEDEAPYEQLTLEFPTEEAQAPEAVAPQAAVKYSKAWPFDVAKVGRLMIACGYKDTHALADAMGEKSHDAVRKALKRGTCSRRMMPALERALGVREGALWAK